MLFVIFSLEKQDLILGYPWLKDHNLEVDWQKNKVLMTCYLPQYKECQMIWKEYAI